MAPGQMVEVEVKVHLRPLRSTKVEEGRAAGL